MIEVSEQGLEKSKSVDQKRTAVLEFVDSNRELFRRQGTIHSTWRMHKGRRIGPYFRLVYRQNGRQCTKYLGKDVRVVDAVATALAKLRLLRNRCPIERYRAILLASFRAQKKEMDRELREHGLSLKGNEIRGGARRRFG